jgi:hypothetical protein
MINIANLLKKMPFWDIEERQNILTISKNILVKRKK